MKRAMLAVAGAVLVAVAFAVAGLRIIAPGVAAPSNPTTVHPRAAILAASDDFAIYQVKSRATNLNAGDYYGGDLYVVGSTGKKRALTTFTDGPRGLELVRDSLVQEKNHSTANSSHYTVHYLDLASGQEGTITLPPGDAEMAAAPGGFVRGYRPDIPTRYGEVLDLELQAYSGRITKLGTPYPDGRVYSVVAGDSGLIAMTSSSDDLPDLDATVRYMSWSDLGAWTTIYDPHKAVILNCARPSATSVACSATGLDSTEAGMIGLIPLHTGAAVSLTQRHPGVCRQLDLATFGSNLVAIETSDAGSCSDGRLIRLGSDGSFAVSVTHYSGLGSVDVGLGKILVSSGEQRDIYSLTGATKTPHVLARA